MNEVKSTSCGLIEYLSKPTVRKLTVLPCDSMSSAEVIVHRQFKYCFALLLVMNDCSQESEYLSLRPHWQHFKFKLTIGYSPQWLSNDQLFRTIGHSCIIGRESEFYFWKYMQYWKIFKLSASMHNVLKQQSNGNC